MNHSFFGLLFLIPTLSFGQETKLFFVKENDSTISVRNDKNKIIIPPFHILWEAYEQKEEIKTDLILVHESVINYKIYDREGKFLFTPTIFDYSVVFSEGHVAFEENRKQGLANKEGKVTIPAEYDYMGFLTNGVVDACKDCYFDRKTDPEHPPLINGTWFQLDKNGNILDTKQYPEKLKSNLDHQFKYSEKEIEILKKITSYKSKIADKIKQQKEEIKFEIVYPPTKYEPHYHIKLYNKYSNSWHATFDDQAENNFFYDPKTDTLYGQYEVTKISKKSGEEYYDTRVKKQPIEKWLKNKAVPTD